MTVEAARAALGTVLDPELGYSVLDLGMIYDIKITEATVQVDYSLTSFGCPLAEELEASIRGAIRAVEPGAVVLPRLVWSPVWGPERLSESLRLELGYPV